MVFTHLDEREASPPLGNDDESGPSSMSIPSPPSSIFTGMLIAELAGDCAAIPSRFRGTADNQRFPRGEDGFSTCRRSRDIL